MKQALEYPLVRDTVQRADSQTLMATGGAVVRMAVDMKLTAVASVAMMHPAGELSERRTEKRVVCGSPTLQIQGEGR